jgi:hypothetical protein
MDERLPLLSDSVIFQIVRAMNLPQNKLTQGMIRLLFGKATLSFSQLALELDHKVGKHGAMEGANWLLRHFVRSHQASGAELIPKEGPLIIAANHPAYYDGLVISAYVPDTISKSSSARFRPTVFCPTSAVISSFRLPSKTPSGGCRPSATPSAI